MQKWSFKFKKITQTVLKHLPNKFENGEILSKKYAQLPPTTTVHHPLSKGHCSYVNYIPHNKPGWKEPLNLREPTWLVLRKPPLSVAKQKYEFKIKEFKVYGRKKKPLCSVVGLQNKKADI